MAGGVVEEFNMFNNSQITMNDGSIGYLNLYDNATATLFGAAYIGHLWVDPSSTGWVKLYAIELSVDPWYDHIEVRWLNSEGPHTIGLLGGESTYDHLQFIPEPASIILLGMGILALRRRRR